MDEKEHNKLWLQDMQELVDECLAQKNYAGAIQTMQEVGDAGFENEALFLHQAINRAKAQEENEVNDAWARGEVDPLVAYDPDNYRPQYPRE